ncbi:MAG: hypothetical protein GF334_13335 [Candidatus Altiarchaeales archaeon]|nr:hypothetical protein [Candidatus Altiarchaeales archaeon]
MSRKKMKDKELSSAYLHIGNSGVTFSVLDTEFGPCIEVSSSSFGNAQAKIRTYTDAKSLEALGTAIIAASKQKFKGEEYCNKATLESLCIDGKEFVEDDCAAFE